MYRRPCRLGRKRSSEGCRRGERQRKMAASWPGGIMTSMAGGKDGGGGKAAAVVLPIVRHGYCCVVF